MITTTNTTTTFNSNSNSNSNNSTNTNNNQNQFSLQDLYAVARRITFELQDGLIRLERLEGKGHGGTRQYKSSKSKGIN